MPASEKKKQYDKIYSKKYEVIKTVKFNRNTDKDILTHIEKIDKPFAKYIKELIRKDIKDSEK